MRLMTDWAREGEMMKRRRIEADMKMIGSSRSGISATRPRRSSVDMAVPDIVLEPTKKRIIL